LTRAAQQNFKAASALAAIPARYALERHQWSEAAALELAPKDFPWANHAWPLALNRFARCLGAARTGHTIDARRHLQLLSELRLPDTPAQASYASRQIEILYVEAKAWAAHSEDQNEEAFRLMRQAADQEDIIEKKPVTPGPLIPARELLGEMFLESGKFGEALTEFDKSLKESPKRFNSLYGAGRAASALKEPVRARDYFAQLITTCQHADADRPELLEAKRLLEQP